MRDLAQHRAKSQVLTERTLRFQQGAHTGQLQQTTIPFLPPLLRSDQNPHLFSVRRLPK